MCVVVLEGVALVMPSRSTIMYIILWLLTCMENVYKSSYTLACCATFLCFRIQGLEIHQGTTSNADLQTLVIDVCKPLISFFNPLLHFHNQIARSEMSLKDKSRI